MAYDIIGDIHGQADKLHALLQQLGYRQHLGAYRHPDPARTAIFVGDLIDRGPHQLDCVNTVRRMIDTGTAQCVMGNHEFNAIAWHEPDPLQGGQFLRPRSGPAGEKNRAQHGAFLAEVERDKALHREVIDWFLTLPLWLDLPGLRVVHACWHDGYIAELQPHLHQEQFVTRELMATATIEGTMAFRTIEGLLKGLELRLPSGHSYQDKEGHTRENARIRWWDEDASTYQSLVLLPGDLHRHLPTTPVEHDARKPYDKTKPVFFGHYWMTGQPTLQAPLFACVDYSAAKEGPLVAYCWDGEQQLDAENFASTPTPFDQERPGDTDGGLAEDALPSDR